MGKMDFSEIERRESWCSGHNSLLSVKSFYKSRSPRHLNKVQPLCKNCANKLCKDFYEQTHELKTAIYYTCAFLDTPFVEKIYEKTENAVRDKLLDNANVDLWSNYMNYFNKLSKKDTDRYMIFMDSDKVGIGTLNGITEEQAKDLAEIKELHRYWGKDIAVEDLEFLEERMFEYTSDISNLSVYQESLYKDLCLTELQIYKKEGVNEAFKQKQKIAEKLGIDVFESNKTASFAEETIENQIFIIEENEPAEYIEQQDLYKDFMGLGKKWLLEILRPVKNLVIGSKDYNISAEDTINFDKRVEQAEEEYDG